jgi:hypothetical protein
MSPSEWHRNCYNILALHISHVACGDAGVNEAPVFPVI